jgi:hypothetical protein
VILSYIYCVFFFFEFLVVISFENKVFSHFVLNPFFSNKIFIAYQKEQNDLFIPGLQLNSVLFEET